MFLIFLMSNYLADLMTMFNKTRPHSRIYRTYFLVSLESGCVKSLAYEFERDEWQTTGSPVIAWQPLPEPYKGEGERE